MKWVIVSCNYGRLGNRLHTHANILAWSIKNNYNLSNLSFRPYSNLFETQRYNSSDSYFKTRNLLFNLMKLNFISDFLERLILSKKWMRRLSFFVQNIEKDDFIPFEENELDSIKSNKVIIIKAWDIRCPNSIKLVGEIVRKLLRPASYYMEPANDFIINLRKHYDCLVGVHARRGDYIKYLCGKHYHEWDIYLNWINETKIVLKRKGYEKVSFILCSDENPPNKIFCDKATHIAKDTHFVTDLSILSLCDFNLGPPSSFGTWISWYGKVPRFVVQLNTEIDSLEKFCPSTSC